MYWQDEGYLLSKNNYDENSIIIEVFTLNHGKYSGIVYGGSSRKQKIRIFKLVINFFKLEILNMKIEQDILMLKLNQVAPYFFDDKKRIVCILSATSILKILLPERQINKKFINF